MGCDIYGDGVLYVFISTLGRVSIEVRVKEWSRYA